MSKPNEKVPSSEDCEKALLSSMMLSPAAVGGAQEFGIVAEDFLNPQNQELFALLLRMVELSKPLDLVLVSDEASLLEGRNGFYWPAYVTEVFTFCPTGGNWRYYCEVLREKTKMRRALMAANRLMEATQGQMANIEEVARECIEGISSGFKEQKKRETLDDQLAAMLDELERQDALEVFPSGLAPLDEALGGGMLRGELGVIGADTSMGKSILLSMFALQAIMSGRSVLFFSLEMTSTQILRRMCANYVGRPIRGVRDMPTAADVAATLRACSALQGKPLTLITDETDIKSIRYRTQQVNPDLMVVDYVQLMESDEGDNREQKISSITRALKNLAQGRAVMTASQLNDDGLLRDSRAIGQHSDAVLVIEGTDEEPWIKIRKNRRGPRNISIPVDKKGEISRLEHDESRPKEPEKKRAATFRHPRVTA